MKIDWSDYDRFRLSSAKTPQERAAVEKYIRGEALTKEEREIVILNQGLYDPVLKPKGLFAPDIVDRTKPFDEVPWHRWAVLAEGNGFRAQVNHRLSPNFFDRVEDAWDDIELYYGNGSVWGPRENANQA